MRSRRSRHAARSHRSPLLRWTLMLVLGIAATLASSAVRQTTLARYPDVATCAAGCEAAAAGWPLPYLVDHPGRPPANEASLAGALAGADRWRYELLALDVLIWTALFAVLGLLLRRFRR